jgi:hypothetical protein
MEREMLIQGLVKKTEEKNQAFRNFIIGIAMILVGFLLDGLYNAIRMLILRGDFGGVNVEKFREISNILFPFLFAL